jgi:hypothetical protein
MVSDEPKPSAMLKLATFLGLVDPSAGPRRGYFPVPQQRADVVRLEEEISDLRLRVVELERLVRERLPAAPAGD